MGGSGVSSEPVGERARGVPRRDRDRGGRRQFRERKARRIIVTARNAAATRFRARDSSVRAAIARATRAKVFPGRTVELLDRHLRLLDVGVLDDAVAAGAALAAGGDLHEADGPALAEDAAELIHGRGPGDVADVETVGGTLGRHLYRLKVDARAVAVRCVVPIARGEGKEIHAFPSVENFCRQAKKASSTAETNILDCLLIHKNREKREISRRRRECSMPRRRAYRETKRRVLDYYI